MQWCASFTRCATFESSIDYIRRLGLVLDRCKFAVDIKYSRRLIDVQMMKAIGNIKSNAVWEANPDNTKFPRPSATALRDEKERFIRAKYINKQFMKYVVKI